MAITLGAEPAEINLNICRGATFRKKITVSAGETEATAVPIDFTGADAELQIRDFNDASLLLHTMNVSNGGLTLSANGEIDFYISHADTSGFLWDEGEYASLEITYSNGDRECFSYGSVTVSRELTIGN